MKKIYIESAILDIEKINGKDVLTIEQVDNDKRSVDYIYINNFRIQDWRKKVNDGELLTRSNNEKS